MALGYLRLGLSASEVSGGEAQGIKLPPSCSAAAAGTCRTCSTSPLPGCTPPTSFSLRRLNRLLDAENTVVLVEHDLDTTVCADW